jgi:hypothetical protein
VAALDHCACFRVEEVVHFPILTLQSRRFSSLRANFGIGVQLIEREISKNEENLAGVILLELFYEGLIRAACGALKIAVL